MHLLNTCFSQNHDLVLNLIIVWMIQVFKFIDLYDVA